LTKVSRICYNIEVKENKAMKKYLNNIRWNLNQELLEEEERK